MLRRAGRWLLMATMIGSTACAVLVVVLWGVSHVYPAGYNWGPTQAVNGRYDDRSVWSAKGEFGFAREHTGYPVLLIGANGWHAVASNPRLNPVWSMGTSYEVAGFHFMASPVTVIAIPYWMPFTLTLLVAVASWLLWRRRGRRIAAGLCVQCGYDLRGSAGACPECGASRAA